VITTPQSAGALWELDQIIVSIIAIIVFILFLKIFICLFYVCVLCHSLQTHQKRASDHIADGCAPPCGCWELNSGPLEEQPVLLTTEPSLQPNHFHVTIITGISQFI
jgi:cbb3-type cytochrome oxidase subunit 3